MISRFSDLGLQIGAITPFKELNTEDTEATEERLFCRAFSRLRPSKLCTKKNRAITDHSTQLLNFKIYQLLNFSDAHGLLHRHGGEPAMAVAHTAFDDVEEFFVQRARYRAGLAIADNDPVHRTDRRDLGGGSGKEHFVGDVEHLAGNHLLDDREAKLLH